MKNKKILGVVMATAVASMVLSGQIVKASDTAAAGKVKCSGINECKGKSACKTADNACMGHNGCKGKGWIEVESEKACTDKGGKVEH